MNGTGAFESPEFEDHKFDCHGAYDPERDAELLEGLQDMVQKLESGLIRYADLAWLPHKTTGKGVVYHCEIAAIPWDRLEDFVQGE